MCMCRIYAFTLHTSNDHVVHEVHGVNREMPGSSKHLIISAQYFHPTGSFSGTVQKMYACTKFIASVRVGVRTPCIMCVGSGHYVRVIYVCDYKFSACIHFCTVPEKDPVG